MNKKRLISALAVTAVIAVPFSVFAATSDAPIARGLRGMMHMDMSKLTDQQKSDMSTYAQKMKDLEKEYINKMVENGTITREQGDEAINRVENGKADGMMGMGDKDRNGMMGFNYSKLTDAQKALLTENQKQMVQLEKDYLAKFVAGGLMTQAQAESASTRLDAKFKDEQDHFMEGGMMGKGSMVQIPRSNNTPLTDAQKALITEYQTKMEDLRKSQISSMVTAGIITQAQADAMSNATSMDGGMFGAPENGMRAKGGKMEKGGMSSGMSGGMSGGGRGYFGGQTQQSDLGQQSGQGTKVQ